MAATSRYTEALQSVLDHLTIYFYTLCDLCSTFHFRLQNGLVSSEHLLIRFHNNAEESRCSFSDYVAFNFKCDAARKLCREETSFIYTFYKIFLIEEDVR